MSEARYLLQYTDTDGSKIAVLWDPVDDTGEDVRIVVQDVERGDAVVRVPLGALRGALIEAPA
jgi:hypothetical protein